MERTVKKTAYHLQVYALIREDILSGRLALGQRINEYSLAKEFGVSRSPVREAVRMLERDGLLVSTTNGTMVNPLEDRAICEIYQAQQVLEAFAARDCAENMTEKELAELERCVQQCKQAHAQNDMQQVVALNTKFHKTLVSYCQNRLLCTMIDRQMDLAFLARRKEFTTYHKQDEYLSEHSEILRAIQAKDADAVEACVRRHIGHDLAFYKTHIQQNEEER
jgi:DNA-binding GntR family transcriptional regulator